MTSSANRKGLRSAVCAAVVLLLGAAGSKWVTMRAQQGSPTTFDVPKGPIHLERPNERVPESYFGIHIHRPSAQTWPQIPTSEWRIWDTVKTTWYDMEFRQGQWEFSALDQDVALAEEHHVGLLLTLGQSPPWASSRPHDPPSWRAGGPAPPANEEDWKTYVRTVAQRYRGRIKAYEIWNEPNMREFYSGTPVQLGVLAKDAYPIIHQIDPDAIVVSPPVTGWYDVGWFRHLMDVGCGQNADAIAYHFYASPKAPEASIPTILQVRDVMRSHNLENKPLWDTETGYSIETKFKVQNPETGSLSRIVTQADATGYVMRTLLVYWAAGVSRLYWYDWDSNAMGLGDNEGHEKKASAAGYRAIHDWMVGSIVNSCDRDSDGNWICEISRGSRTQWIAWNDEGKTNLKSMPASWIVTSISTIGPTGKSVTEAHHQRTISFNSTPVLLR